MSYMKPPPTSKFFAIMEEEAVSKRDVIFIIGTMRSGTSALTRVLSLCGCDLPELVQGPRSFNPTGNWDAVESISINNEFLFSFQTRHDDPGMRFQESHIEEGARERFIQKIELFLKSCPGTSAILVKDHTITNVAPFWITAARNLDYTPNFIIPVRRVGQCVLSTRLSAPSLPDELTQHVWLKSNLLAERSSRGVQRVFVEYSNLMKDWTLQICRISRSLNVALDIEKGYSAQEFLDPRLWHHRVPSEEASTDALVLNWCEAVYQEFSSAAVDKPINHSRLDKIFSEFESGERSFRIAADYFRTQYTPEEMTKWLESLPNWKAGVDF